MPNRKANSKLFPGSTAEIDNSLIASGPFSGERLSSADVSGFGSKVIELEKRISDQKEIPNLTERQLPQPSKIGSKVISISQVETVPYKFGVTVHGKAS